MNQMFHKPICNGTLLYGTLTATLEMASGYTETSTQRFVGDRKYLKACAKYWANGLKEEGWDEVRIAWTPDEEILVKN